MGQDRQVTRRAALGQVGVWMAAPALASRPAAGSGKGDAMIVDRVRWTESFEGYFVDGCAVQDARRYFFVMPPDRDLDDDDAPPTRLLYVNADRAIDARRFVRGSLNFSSAGLVFSPQGGEFVAIGLGGEVFSYDGDRGKNEAELPMVLPTTDLRAVVHGVGRVGGTVYATGWPHRVWKRRGAGAWDTLTAGLPPARLGPSADIVTALHENRLRAIAGFDDDDLYAVGDGGEIWQWVGARWRRRAAPCKEAFLAASAAYDRVFLADETGALWTGRSERWTRVTGPQPYPITDLAWFAGRLWCGFANGALKRLEGARVAGAGAPSAVSPGIHHLDVAPDGSCLVAAGRWGAALHDGARWRVLFGGTAPA